MDTIVDELVAAYKSMNGYDLASTLSPDPFEKRPKARENYHKEMNSRNINDLVRNVISNESALRNLMSKEERNGWIEVYASYFKALREIIAAEEDRGGNGSWTEVYDAWKELTSMLIRGYTNHSFEAWTIPCLYMAGKHLRLFAIRSDEERNSASTENGGVTLQDDFDPESEKHQQLEDCARQLNRIFNVCLSDRAPLADSRKWGIYYVINLLFKTYFRLNSASLSRNVLKALSAYRGDMPPLTSFPKSQQVTFKYYEGVLSFLEENYADAETHLTTAWQLCHKDAHRNKELILTYLIPTRLLTTHSLPSKTLLEPYPQLARLFTPISAAIRRGDLAGFDAALVESEEALVRRRIYLTLERSRDVALRNLLRRVFLAGGWVEEPAAGGDGGVVRVRRTRIPVKEFVAAVTLSSAGGLSPGDVQASRVASAPVMDQDEVECMLANMIYKGLMKGYIARERGIVVLSKAGAFPGTGV